MTPEPNQDPLSDEIESALDGVNLQELDMSDKASGRGGDGLYSGQVVGVTGDDVIVDLGPRMQGVVSVREFEEPPKVGDVHRFTLHGRDDELWILSLREAQAIAAWADLEEGAHVKARVSGQNTGGLQLKIGSNDAFMPASHVALGREDDLSKFIGQTLVCQVLEIDKSKKRVVLSRRKVLEQEAEKARSDSASRISPGQVVTGKVTRIEPFGAFVDVGGGLEGLVHVSNMSRKRVNNPEELVKKGDDVQVMILEIKEGGKRIGLGMKHLEPDPWDGIEQRIAIDSIHTGKVTRLADFGAFVEIEDGVDGLLHVSQMSTERVRRAADHFKVGDEVSVRVTALDVQQGRLSLSRLDPRGAVLGSEEAVDAKLIDAVLDKSGGEGLKTNLGDLFKRAMDKKTS